MSRRTVDVVAAGPPSEDPYDPAASAWALAQGLAERGHSVQVVYPGPEEGRPPPPGLSAVPFPAVTAHVGSLRGDAELMRSAAGRLRPGADAVVRDPAGLGALGSHRPAKTVVAFVRALAKDALDGGPAGRGRRDLLGRVASWGERRDIHRLEREALAEATTVYCASRSLRTRVWDEYGLPTERLRLASTVVADGPQPPPRTAARRAVGVPDDVGLVAVLSDDRAVPPEAYAPALEAFGRVRRIFPGSRLAVVGLPQPNAPGVVALPGRDRATLTTACAAADVGLLLGRTTVPEPGLVHALRAGLPCVAPPELDLGDGAEGALRRADPADAAELAGALVELLADPAARGTLATCGRSVAERFRPARFVQELEAAGALGAN